MRTFLGTTWLAALLFALPVFLFEFLSPGVRRPPAGTHTLFMLFIVPPVWWVTMAKKGQASIASGAGRGALCGVILVLIPTMVIGISLMLADWRHGQSGSMGVYAAFLLLIMAAAILVPLGAGIGALTTWLQRRGRVEHLT